MHLIKRIDCDIIRCYPWCGTASFTSTKLKYTKGPVTTKGPVMDPSGGSWTSFLISGWSIMTSWKTKSLTINRICLTNQLCYHMIKSTFFMQVYAGMVSWACRTAPVSCAHRPALPLSSLQAYSPRASCDTVPQQVLCQGCGNGRVLSTPTPTIVPLCSEPAIKSSCGLERGLWLSWYYHILSDLSPAACWWVYIVQLHLKMTHCGDRKQ